MDAHDQGAGTGSINGSRRLDQKRTGCRASEARQARRCADRGELSRCTPNSRLTLFGMNGGDDGTRTRGLCRDSSTPEKNARDID